MSELARCLDDLERRIDPEVEEDLVAQWKVFLEDDAPGGAPIFSPRRRAAAPAGIDWPVVGVNEALEDADRMALQQYGACSALLASGGGAPLAVRANYGTGILPSIFGAEIFLMDPALNTLPTTRPLPGGADGIRRLLDTPPPDPDRGLMARALAMGREFQAIAAAYPRIGRFVHVYHPDLQGAMDACELLWGSGLFVDIVDHPELVHAFLERVTAAYIACMRAWFHIVPPREGPQAHWGIMHHGRLMIRTDSAMNFSPAMFAEFIEPYEQRLLDAFGGGALHFCGRGDHYVDRLAPMGIRELAMSQPSYNDMEHIYRHTVDRGIRLLGFDRAAAEKALAAGRELHGRVNG